MCKDDKTAVRPHQRAAVANQAIETRGSRILIRGCAARRRHFPNAERIAERPAGGLRLVIALGQNYGEKSHRARQRGRYAPTHRVHETVGAGQLLHHKTVDNWIKPAPTQTLIPADVHDGICTILNIKTVQIIPGIGWFAVPRDLLSYSKVAQFSACLSIVVSVGLGIYILSTPASTKPGVEASRMAIEVPVAQKNLRP